MPKLIKGVVDTRGQREQLTQALKKRHREEPLWKGPETNDSLGGITQSMLGKYLGCPERFRLNVIEGLKEAEQFYHRMEFGNMWHVCEESLAHPTQQNWKESLLHYCKQLTQRYRDQQQEIEKWYNVILRQFPVYIGHWSKHPDVRKRKPIYQEQVFKVKYTLPSGRTVYLRGKFDAVDLIEDGLYIQENKSKGEVNKEQIERQLKFDLQSNFYTVALLNDEGMWVHKVKKTGVRYNVVRRPLSDGKYCIRQLKGRGKEKKGAETTTQYYDRLGKLIAGDPEYFFVRFRTEISPRDIGIFKAKSLNPILENLCDDYEWWSYCYHQADNPEVLGKVSVFDYNVRQNRFPDHQRRHYILPFGIYNPLFEGRGTSLDQFIMTGDDRGLQRRETLFEELQ